MQSSSVLYFRVILIIYAVMVSVLCAFGGNLHNPLLYLMVVATLIAIALPVNVLGVFLVSATICTVTLVLSITKNLTEGAAASFFAMLVISQRADMLLLRSENKNSENKNVE